MFLLFYINLYIKLIYNYLLQIFFLEPRPIDNKVWLDLNKRIISISIRSQMNKNNQIRAWVLELVFYGTPFSSSNNQAEHNQKKTLYLTYDQTNNYNQTVEDILLDWAKIVYLYILVYDFVNYMKKSKFINLIIINSFYFLHIF